MATKNPTYCIESYPYNRPETIERGVLEKGLGQSTLSGATIQVLNKRAEVGVPNWTEAWGVRLNAAGEIPKDKDGNVIRLDIKDTAYKGQIKELKWNDPNGCLIVCRFLSGYNTLDQQYQDVVLGAKDSIREDSEAAADAFYLRLASGDNWYDPESDRYLVQMLRIHYMNETSVFRNPKSQNYMFREKNFDKIDTEQSKTLNAKFESLKIVNESAKDNTLAEIRNLKGILGAILNQDVKDEDLYRYLSMIADTKPAEFLNEINQYKKKVSDIFEKAKSWNILDLTKDGMIAAGETKKELIGSDIPGKKEGMLDWVFENYLNEKAYEIVQRLKTITDKLK